MAKNNANHVRLTRSILALGVGIVALSVGLVCSILFVLSVNAEREALISSLQEEAEVSTYLTASTLGGAVRFGNNDAIIAGLETVQRLAGAVFDGGVVVNTAGEALGAVGASLSTEEMALATQAVGAGEPQISADGLAISVPVRTDANAPPVGALVVAWDPSTKLTELAEARRAQVFTVGMVFVATLALTGFVFRLAIAKPLTLVSERTAELAAGDLESDVPCKGRADEIGLTARNLDGLRSDLWDAAVQQEKARFQAIAFETTSAALLLADTDLKITQFNPAFRSLMTEIEDGLIARGIEIDMENLVGRSVDDFHNLPEAVRQKLDEADAPLRPTLQMGSYSVSLDIAKVRDAEGKHLGYLVEWRDRTASLRRQAIMDAIDAGQLRAEFHQDGTLHTVNDNFLQDFPGLEESLGTLAIDSLLGGGNVHEALAQVRDGESVFGQFECSANGHERIISGNISPLQNHNGEPNGYILIGKDVTEQVAAEKEAQRLERQQQEDQEKVVRSLTQGLSALARGDLSTRLEDGFAPEYESLRHQFNDSIESLDDAVSLFIDNSASILEEASNISGAAGDLSKRTEQQATTLEGFVAALTEVTASVASTAQGASQANSVVDEARGNAEASGSVVREAVQAMGEISSSSEQIGRIIGVIDDIAFQTNLLALNAGVEAARAGDAGRGFAVVASEVRALAQRSSDAAREINTLISTSGAQVKKGVSLVDKAGAALTEIVESVGGIAEHVATIAASAKEQSAGPDEISTSISQLDQVTQQNVAMFEETTAATHTLTNEANVLVSATQKFRTTKGGAGVDSLGTDSLKVFEPETEAEKLAFEEDAIDDAIPVTAKPSPATASDGNAALDFDDGDWDDF